MLHKIGIKSIISADCAELDRADAIVLPGVGAFGAGMQALKQRQMINWLGHYAASGRMLVGICLGMQLLGNWSDEDHCAGLGLIEARFKKFKFDYQGQEKLPVPHMGWNYVKLVDGHRLKGELLPSSRFYFVHSYYASDVAQQNILLTADYGDTFVAAYNKNNIFGFQFHPEKSHLYGMHLFRLLFFPESIQAV